MSTLVWQILLGAAALTGCVGVVLTVFGGLK